jgi:hypothetical protein
VQRPDKIGRSARRIAVPAKLGQAAQNLLFERRGKIARLFILVEFDDPTVLFDMIDFEGLDCFAD